MNKRFILNQSQLHLPFGEGGGRTRILSLDNRQRFFWLMVGVSVLSLFAYVYAINATARNIALRGNLESKVAESSTKLGALEFAYIELTNEISLETAYALGFKEANSPLYVSRDKDVSLTLNTESR